ncbi:hypothetical protein ACFQX6_63015 [Streptosporangium lutulentum]
MIAAYLIPFLCGVKVPLGPGQADTLLYRPYLALLVVAVPVATILTVTRGSLRAWALVTVMFAAIGLPADVHARVLSVVDRIAENGVPTVAGTVTTSQTMPEGALEAAGGCAPTRIRTT